MQNDSKLDILLKYQQMGDKHETEGQVLAQDQVDAKTKTYLILGIKGLGGGLDG